MTDGRRFLDTNVLLRFLLNDHDDHSRRSLLLFRRLERGEEEAVLGDTVIFEAVYHLESHLGMPRQTIADILLAVLTFEGIHLASKDLYPTVFRWFVAIPKLSFADCFHGALAQSQTDGQIYSFDRDFDRIVELDRHEPD